MNIDDQHLTDDWHQSPFTHFWTFRWP